MNRTDTLTFLNRWGMRTNKGCTLKKQYETKAEARKILNSGVPERKGLEPYHCRECGFWHLGH